MPLKDFADFVNAMRAVIIDRFGQESQCTVTVVSDNIFLLKNQICGGDGMFLGESIHKIETNNVESVVFKEVSFHEFSTGGPTLYFVNIILRNSIPDTAGGRCRAVGMYAESQYHGTLIKEFLEKMAGL